MLQTDLLKSNKASSFTFNGHGWDIQSNSDIQEKIIFFQDEKKTLENELLRKKHFSYVCMNTKEQEFKGSLFDNMYIGIPNIADNSKLYYQYIGKIKNKRATFQNIFSESLLGGKYDNITDAVLVVNERNIDSYEKISMKKLIIGNKSEEYHTLCDEIESSSNTIYFFVLDDDTPYAIEEFSRKIPSRTYVDARIFENEVGGTNGIRWMFRPERVSFDVDVVLTLYKKPEALKLQIEALRQQTLQPASLNLYQDGVEDGYRIVLTESTRKKFDEIEVSNTNKGVWERFRWAKKCKSDYVCVFDDDTIPRTRWLENCHVHMQEETGVYGANGVLLSNLRDYPMGGALNPGWHVASISKIQVDLVGHSWFFEKKLLDYIPDETAELKRYKYTGEDMFLSYQALEHGRKTFTPPHPLRYPELWSSVPKIGWKFGTAEGSLSIVKRNIIIRNEFLKKLISDGWKPVVTNNLRYVKSVEEELKENDACHQIRQMLIEFFALGNVFIYGAGNIAKKLLKFVERENLDIKGFITTKKEENPFESYRLFQIDTLLIEEKNPKIVLGLGEQYHVEVRDKMSTIKDANIFPTRDSIFSYGDFLEAIE